MRFMDANENELKLFNKIKEEYFPELCNCRIKVLMDTKKKMSKGEMVFGSIKKASEVEKYLTSDNVNDEGYDFMLMLDGNVFDNIAEADKEKIIRHELRHIFFDSDAKNPYKIVGHDVEDFLAEIKLNADDPDWRSRVTEVAKSIYDKN